MYTVTAKNAPDIHNSQRILIVNKMLPAGALDESLVKLSTDISCEAKQSLFWEGDSAEYVYKVKRGMVCLYKLLPDGRRQVARFCGVGDLLGLGQRMVYQYTADTVTPVSLLRVRRAELEAEIETNLLLRNELLAVISDELRAAQDQLVLLGRKSAIERVASFVEAMAGQNRRQGDNALIVDLPMTRVDIADYLGLTHETVCRAFSQLKAQGVLNIYDHHLVEICQPDMLTEIATGEGTERLCA